MRMLYARMSAVERALPQFRCDVRWWKRTGTTERAAVVPDKERAEGLLGAFLFGGQ